MHPEPAVLRVAQEALAGVDVPVTGLPDAHRRLVDTLRAGGSADVAGLVRQVLRRAAHAGIASPSLDVPAALCDVAGWRAHSCTALPTADDRTLRVQAEPWRPGWLGSGEAIDLAVTAGLPMAVRRHEDRVPADPFFANTTGHSAYRGAGQRQAARAAALLAPGAALLVGLPTGSGKTEVFLGPALTAAASRGTSVLFVPTISLAQDMDRRITELLRTAGRYVRTVAYTSETPDDESARIRHEVAAGTLPIVVTSPESGLRSLRPSLRSAAGNGWLRYFAVDEAHLVREWGVDFRPDLAALAALRRELIEAAPTPDSRCRTLLLSATFAPADFVELPRQYGDLAVVAANALRPEPDYHFARAPDENTRAEWVIEAICHLPKPLFVYTSWVDDAEEWVSRLRHVGLRRVGRVTGAVPGTERADVLRGLRGDDGATRYDVVVATSAFGLGISYDAVRTVVHACLPESVDRLYQEVGRAGRDGNASVALTVWTASDRGKAAPLARRVVIGWSTAKKRWDAMAHDSVLDTATGRVRVDLTARPPQVAKASDLNVSWNVATLALMARAGFVSWIPANGTVDEETGRPARSAVVEASVGDLAHEEVWSAQWLPMAREILADAERRRAAVERALSPGMRVCEVLVDAFRATGDGPRRITDVAPADSCGQCATCGFADRAAPAPAPEPDPPAADFVDPDAQVVRPPLKAGRPTLVLTTSRTTADPVDSFLTWMLRMGARQFVVPATSRDLPALRAAVRDHSGPLVLADYDIDVPWLLPYVVTAVVSPLDGAPVHPWWLIGDWQPATAVLVTPTTPSPLRGDRPVSELRPPGTMTIDDLAGAGA